MLDLLKEDTLFLVLSSIWLSYFIVLGFNNTWKRLICVMVRGDWLQSNLGSLMDITFYALTFFITIKYFI